MQKGLNEGTLSCGLHPVGLSSSSKIFGSQTEYGFCIENFFSSLVLGLHTKAADKDVLPVCADAVVWVLRISPKTHVVLAWFSVVTIAKWMNLQEVVLWRKDVRPVLEGDIGKPLEGLLGYWVPPFPLYLTAAVE